MQPFDPIKKSSFYGGCYLLVNFDMNPNVQLLFIVVTQKKLFHRIL